MNDQDNLSRPQLNLSAVIFSLIAGISALTAVAQDAEIDSAGTQNRRAALLRIGHSDVREANMGDGAALEHYYYDVAAFDWGGVVPLNVWFHPQLMHFHPQSALLEHVAMAAPHAGQGNEDDKRMKIFSHRGQRAEDSFVMFTIYGYEDIEEENGKFNRDSAVMSLRTVETLAGSGLMPRRKARVVNMLEEEAKKGLGSIPASCGAPYDQANRIVFAPRQRPQTLADRELFQMFRFDPSDGSFQGRSSFSLPEDFTPQHEISFMDVSSEYGLIAIGAVTPWRPKPWRGSVYLMQYENEDDEQIAKVSFSQCADSLALQGHQEEGTYTPTPTAACFADDGEAVYLLLAGGDEGDKSPEEHSSGIYVYRLGPIGGPYRMAESQGKLPLAHGVTEIEVHNGRVYASSQGMHVYDLKEVLATSGEKDEHMRPLATYPLPYDTHGFDFASIAGGDYLFLAAARHGLDIFAIDAEVGICPASLDSVGQELTISGRSAEVVLESGTGVKNMEDPAMSANGHMALRATSASNGEVILRKLSGKGIEVIADSAQGEFVSFGRPAINDQGQVAFWAARADGSQAVLRSEGKTLEEIASSTHDFLYVRYPEIANDRSIAFGGKLKTGEQANLHSVFLARPGEQPQCLFTEDRANRHTLSTRMVGDFGADYDISPDGTKVVFAYNKHPRNASILVWEDGSVRPFVAEELPQIGFVRFGHGGDMVTFRGWSKEVISMNRANSSGISQLVHRHAKYGDPEVNPGNFTGSRADSRGNTLFATTENTLTGKGRRPLGDQLWLQPADSTQEPEILIKPLDHLQGSEVLHIGFFDSFANNGTAALTIDLRDKGQTVTQKLVLMSVVDP